MRQDTVVADGRARKERRAAASFATLETALNQGLAVHHCR